MTTKGSIKQVESSISTFASALKSFPATSDPFWDGIEKSALEGQLESLKEDAERLESLRNHSDIDSLQNLVEIILFHIHQDDKATAKLLPILKIDPAAASGIHAEDLWNMEPAILHEAAKTLGLKLSAGLSEILSKGIAKTAMSQFEDLGLGYTFIIDRLLPRSLGAALDSFVANRQKVPKTLFSLAVEQVSSVLRMPIPLENGSEQLCLHLGAYGATSFKGISDITDPETKAFVLYCHYLSLLVLKATADATVKGISENAATVRKGILQYDTSVNFTSVLNYAWSLGIPVIPVKEKGLFHGACIRDGNRNAIILKQGNASAARWLFDLLHELWHASQKAEAKNRIQVELSETRSSKNGYSEEELKEEAQANDFAGNVIFDGKADELSQKCIKEAGGNLQFLKRAVQTVAAREKVQVDCLANYLAHRLSLQGENWWGVAHNLQTLDIDPVEIAKDKLLSEVQFKFLDSNEAKMLEKAFGFQAVF